MQAASTNENISPKAMKAIMLEIRELTKAPIDGVKVIMNEECITDVQADINGPEGTPYEGGVFRMKLALGADFPNVPPKGFFTTKIFHPNVSAEGEICVNTLKKDWKPNLGIRHILTVIRCLLIDPNPESALNDEAGKLLLEAYDDFAQRARMMTDLYAGSGGDAKADCQGAAAAAPSASSSSSAPKAKKSKKADKKKSASLRRL